MGNVSTESMTGEQMKAELARLTAENNKLKARTASKLSIRVSEKGAVSVYGLGRFPVTLYKEQWERLLAIADTIRDFIKDNAGALKSKEEQRAEVAA